MTREVRRCGECRAAGEQSRTANRQQHFADQSPESGALRRLALGVNAGVDVLAIEVGALVRCRDLHVDAWMQRMEAREARDQPANGKRRRKLEPQQALVRALLQLARGMVDLVERAAERAKVGRSLRGQRDSPLCAYEETRAEPLLQGSHVTAYRPLRDGQLMRGTGDAPVACDSLEGADGIERWKAAQHGQI